VVRVRLILSERARVSPLDLTYLYTRAALAGQPTGI